MINKTYFLVFALFFVLLFSSCGSSVEDIGRDKGTADITLNDVKTEDVVDDSWIGSDGSSDTTEDVWIEDISVSDSEMDVGSETIEDVGNEDSVAGDLGYEDSFDADIEDVSGDIGVDAQTDISPADIGVDVGEDAGTGYCKVGEKREYKCPDGNMVDWCVCDYKGCKPYCGEIGTEREGWYDCNGKLIRYASCAKCSVICDKWGTKSEGWYTDTDCGGLIQWDQCAPDWFCLESPEVQCEQRCSDSCDCPSDKPLCVKGVCDNIDIIGCNGDNNLCPCGWYCSGEICVEGLIRCQRSCDCKESQICVNGTCKDKMSRECTNEPCPCNSYCAKNPFGVDTCQKGCLNNCDCPANSPICSAGTCVSGLILDCKGDDRLCPCMQVCVNGKCVKSDEFCNNSCECNDPLRQVCVNMVCTDGVPDCTSDSECPCGKSCIKGVCSQIVGCRDSCDCGKEEICQNGKCIPYLGDPCKTDLQCPCNSICSNGKCIIPEPPQCKYSCDCPKDMICQNGRCERYVVYKCLKDNDCLCGNYCDLSSSEIGYCTSGCNDPCDCPDITPYCMKGQCAPGDIIPVACRSNSDCKCGEICKDRMCIFVDS